MNSTTRLWVPSTFWADHADRTPCDNPETDMAQEIESSGNRTLIEATAKQLETLKSDAAYYCDKDGPDECPANLIRSAIATLNAIARARPPEPQKANRGGKREGAGRPGLGVKRLNVTLDEDTIETLRALGDGNVSEGIRRAAALL